MMSPKKAKDAIDAENYWRMCIEDAPLDDDSWNVKVILIEASGSDQDRIYLNKFETYAAEERRFVIKNICKTETIFMVNQLGGEKKVKDDNLRVFEEGQAFLKDKRNIPPEILALIIKHQILKMKSKYLFIKQQRLEVNEGMKRESTIIVNKAEVRGTVNVKPLESAEITSLPLKGKKGEIDVAQKPVEVIDENKKYSTLLRVRGEEWRDKVYIDDYPSDGPNIYVAVTGFLEPHLPRYLVKIGIPLTAVVQIRIDPTTTTIPSSLFRATKRGQSHTDVLAEKSLKFWEDLQQLRLSKDYADDFKNTAFIMFSPPYWNNDNLSGSPEKIYDEICFLLYDIQDLHRQHIHYLKNMDIISVSDEHKDNRYLHVYDRYMDGLPFESITSYLVLDSILQTLSKGQFDDKSNMSSLLPAVTVNQTIPNAKDEEKLNQSKSLVNKFIQELSQIECYKKKYRFIYGDEYENHKNPIVINYGDFCKYNTFHLGDLKLDNIVPSMLLGMPINNLWLNRNRPTPELEAKINFHINALLTCFDRKDVEAAELNRLIHILVCRKLYNNRSSLKKEHVLCSTISEFKKTYLKRSVLAEPLSKSSTKKCSISISPSSPSVLKNVEESNMSLMHEEDEISQIKFLFDCPDLSELVSAAEIVNKKPFNHMIEEFEYFEDFTGRDAFQVMLDAFNKFNCVDYKYCEVTDCYVMMFFNSHDKDGIAREEWRCHFPTPLCLQDFFDFVLEEHYDWIRDEEKIYDENIALRSQSEGKDYKGPLVTKACIDKTEVEMELLIEGSLKYEEIVNLDIASPESSESKFFSGKKTTSASSVADIDSKSSKKSKSSAPATPKKINPGSKEAKEKRAKKFFSAYDLGNRRIEFFGKNSSYFSKDGTRVSSFYSLLIPINLEYVTLNVVPGNGPNEFWMHKAIGEIIRTGITDSCESFRINTKDQLLIYIKKQTYQVPVPLLYTSLGNVKNKESTARSPSPDINNMTPQIFKNRSYHSLYVTWPNGLITESIYETNSPKVSHIKQFYLSPPSHLDEDMRCVSLNGEVIIFKCNGDINVLQPDASYINITKYEKKYISDELLAHIPSTASSDKSKKGKEKGKGKEKFRKTSSKSSKSVISECEKEFDSRPLDYKLIIEEFEVIESNGLRRKCINNSYFDIEKLLIKSATDYCLGEIFSKRMDGTNILLNKDGVQLVTFPNNTRILTKFITEDEEIFPEWTEDEIEYLSMIADGIDVNALNSKGSKSQKSITVPKIHNSSENSFKSIKITPEHTNKKEQRSDGYISIHIIYIIEHPNFTTITIDKRDEKVAIESPNNTCVTFDKNNHYEFLLDSQTSAMFNGDSLIINYEACSECKSFTTCEVNVKSKEIGSVTQIKGNWLEMKDSFCKYVTVNVEGDINVVSGGSSDQIIHYEESVYSKDQVKSTNENQIENNVNRPPTSHGKCSQIFEAKSLKFFILTRELTCSELVHRAIIEEYKQTCRSQPWCSINQYDTFGDHRTLCSVLIPIYQNESEKWLMESQLSAKPNYLTYKDLKTDTGKGFYHWMRPYKRFEPNSIKPDNVLPQRLPRAFILRTLEQQWKEAEREELKGAKELLKAILRYRNVMESDCETILRVPIHDSRPGDERRTDEIVQAIAHRIYEDIKARLAEGAQTRAKPNIATTPHPPQENMVFEVEGQLGKEDAEANDELSMLEEDRMTAIKAVETAVEISPSLKRYWRRRAEELKEEQFYKYLLREGSVPPYFRNVLSGAIWLEIDKALDDAITNAERSKMKCVYEEDMNSGH